MMQKPRLWSLNAAAVEVSVDRRTLAKRLANVPADGRVAGRAGWKMATIMQALMAHGARQAHEVNRADTVLDQLVAAAKGVDALLADMRAERDIPRRRRMLAKGGRVFGELDRLLGDTADRQDENAALVARAFIDRLMAGAMREILTLTRQELATG
jgi:hypothetical protein